MLAIVDKIDSKFEIYSIIPEISCLLANILNIFYIILKKSFWWEKSNLFCLSVYKTNKNGNDRFLRNTFIVKILFIHMYQTVAVIDNPKKCDCFFYKKLDILLWRIMCSLFPLRIYVNIYPDKNHKN